MDSEIIQQWRDLRHARQEKRAANRESSTARLVAAGIRFTSHNGGSHLIITHDGKTVNFWPGTGNWSCKSGIKGRGIFKLIRHLGIYSSM